MYIYMCTYTYGTFAVEKPCFKPGMSNLRPMGLMQPRMAMNATQNKIINFLKTL